MGDIIGGIIGGVGSLLGGNKAAKQDLTGYNYLTGKNGVGGFVQQGNAANNQAMGALTGNNPSAMANYLNSTGYNFQLKQGQQAITGSAAARGLLNSGGTAKSLMQFGQGLAGNYFNNYLNQLGNVAGRGLQASGQIGQAGTVGGGNAGSMQQSGISSGFNQFGSAAGSLYQNPGVQNFLGSI